MSDTMPNPASRRALLKGAASLAALAAPHAAALASPVTLDPVFAAINAHRVAWAAYEEAIIAQGVIEAQHFRSGGMERLDPVYAEAEALVAATSVTTDAAFERIAATTPSTLAGLAALAHHALGTEAQCHGHEGMEELVAALGRGLVALATVDGRA